MPGIPFVGSLYDYSRGPGANISNLLLERGRAQADSAARIGQIWGNTVANLGQIPRQLQEDKLVQARLNNDTALAKAREDELKQHALEREQDIAAQAAKQKAEESLFAKIHSGEPVKVEDFYQTYGKDGFAAYKSYQEAQSPKPDARTLLTGLGMASDEYLQHSWPVLQPKISAALGVPAEAIPQWDRAKYNEFMQAQGWAKAPEKEKTPEPKVVGHSLVDPVSGKVIYRDPESGGSEKPGALKPVFDKQANAMVFASDDDIRKSPDRYTPAPTTVERTRKDQASHVIEQAASLVKELDKPEVKDLFGGVSGYIAEQRNKPGLMRALAPLPESANHVKASLASLSAFLPILHGMRGGENMIAHFEGVLGDFTSTPEQVKAAAKALGEAAKRIQDQGDQADLTDLLGGGSTSGPKPGDIEDGYKFKGGDPSDQNNWEKQ